MQAESEGLIKLYGKEKPWHLLLIKGKTCCINSWIAINYYY